MKVVKYDGRTEALNRVKLAWSLVFAAQDAGLAIDHERFADIVMGMKLDGDQIHSRELMDRVHLVLLRRSVEEPELGEVARLHLLGLIWKEAVGRGFLVDRRGRDQLYREAFVRNVLRLRELGVVDAGRLAVYEPHLWELAEVLDWRRDAAIPTYGGVRLFYSGNYALRFPDWRIAEAPQFAAMRVAMAVALAEKQYGGDPVYWAKRFYEEISKLRIVPASPYWFNALTPRQVLGSCFTLRVEDCLSSATHPGRNCIYDALAQSGLIQQAGGGVGYDFSELRPRGDVVRGSWGVASGPVSFMRLFDVNVDVIKQGGKRRGAQMGLLAAWHPDIREFARAKTGEAKDKTLQNFNISALVDYNLIVLATVDGKYPLINPRKAAELGIDPVYAMYNSRPLPSLGSVLFPNPKLEEAVVEWTPARELFEMFVRGAYESGDPGLVFIDAINAVNPYMPRRRLVTDDFEAWLEVPGGRKVRLLYHTVNPCAETPQPAFSMCNLVQVNLTAFVKQGNRAALEDARDVDNIYRRLTEVFDFDEFERVVRLAVRFADDAVDASDYPIPEIEYVAKAERRLGIGVAGLHDALIAMGLRYASWDAVKATAAIMAWMYGAAVSESNKLAQERGPFPLYERVHNEKRNTIAPLLWAELVAQRCELVRWVREVLRNDSQTMEVPSSGNDLVDVFIDASGLREELAKDLDSNNAYLESLEKWCRHADALVDLVYQLSDYIIRRFGLSGWPRRNATVLSIAPTGRTSTLMGVSSGIEPIYALAVTRNTTVGLLVEYHRAFVEEMRRRGLWSREVARAVEERGLARDLPDTVPIEVKRLFETAMEIDPTWHVLIDAVATAFVDQGVSKTVNLPAEATVDTVRDVYLGAAVLGLRGITVFRDASKSVQVLYAGVKTEQVEAKRLDKQSTSVASVKLGRIELGEIKDREDLLAEVGRDPYCETGECG